MAERSTGQVKHSVFCFRLIGVSGLIFILAMTVGCPNPVPQEKSIWSNSVGWSYVGNPGFSPAAVGSVTMAFQPTTGVPYVAFQDWGISKGVLWTLSGGNWIQVGGPFSSGDVGTVSLAFYPGSGEPVAAFQDSTTTPSGRASAMFYDGATWNPVGAGGISFSPDVANDNTALVIDSTGQEFVAFQDPTTAPPGMLSVMYHSGATWLYYPVLGISAGGAWQITMNVDSSNTLSIAYSDGNQVNNATELFYNAGSWLTRGGAGFAPCSVWNLHSAVSPSGMQYVVFEENNGPSYGATVMEYSGGIWSLVGPRNFSPGQIDGAAIAIDTKGTPYVAFLDLTNGDRITVMKFDGSNWNVVGKPGFTTGSVDYLSLVIGPGDVPYVSFRDLDPLNFNKASVMAYQ
jgi:hypothetical protein